MILTSWISPKAIKARPSHVAGRGLFAKEDIKKDEVIAVKAGHIINTETLHRNENLINGAEAQLGVDLYIAPMSTEEYESTMIFCNHSCEPNSGIGGNILSVAIRDIKAGEEITFDYATHQSDPNYRLNCKCGAPTCRKVVTGNDWMIVKLQNKYAGYFSWYLEQKIELLRTSE